MIGIDREREFIPLGISVLTVSDTRTEETDRSGKLLVERLTQAGHRLIEKKIVPDEIEKIQNTVKDWIKRDEIDVILVTGGTGITGRDVTPEALQPLWGKELPGFGEQFRRLSWEKIGAAALLSRACAGIAGKTYIFALPGSTGACRDAWDELLIFLLDSRYRPCNLADMLPRLGEK